jgi:hypothetical protein
MTAGPRYIATAQTAQKTHVPTVTPLFGVTLSLPSISCFSGSIVLALNKYTTIGLVFMKNNRSRKGKIVREKETDTNWKPIYDFWNPYCWSYVEIRQFVIQTSTRFGSLFGCMSSASRNALQIHVFMRLCWLLLSRMTSAVSTRGSSSSRLFSRLTFRAEKSFATKIRCIRWTQYWWLMTI